MDAATGYGQGEPEEEERSEVRTMKPAMKGQRKAAYSWQQNPNQKKETANSKTHRKQERKEGNRREEGGVNKCLDLPRSRFRRVNRSLLPKPNSSLLFLSCLLLHFSDVASIYYINSK